MNEFLEVEWGIGCQVYSIIIGHLCIDDILRRDKVISQPKMSARIANIIVVRCTIQYSDIAVSS